MKTRNFLFERFKIYKISEPIQNRVRFRLRFIDYDLFRILNLSSEKKIRQNQAAVI